MPHAVSENIPVYTVFLNLPWLRQSHLSKNVCIGALDWGWGVCVLMSHVDFKKCKCCISLLLNISPVPCQIQEMSKSHVTILFEPMSLSMRVMSSCRI